MKKLSFLFLALITITKSFSQDNNSELPRMDNDTLFTSSGYKVVNGQDVKLGTGSLPYGDFKYITISSSSWLTAGSTNQEAVGRKWNGHLFKVKKVRKEGTKKRGFTFYLILGGGNIVNYECDIESAIASGEIVVPEEYKPKQKAVVVERGKAFYICPTTLLCNFS